MIDAAGEERLLAEFGAICDTGGRLSGTESEAAAVALLKRLGAEATGVEARVEPIEYLGWRPLGVELTGADGTVYLAHPLVRSASTPPEGVEAEVIDLGRGSPDEFEAHKDEIAGRIALVRHELMFNPATIHRRKKYQMAVAAGAAGFMIAGPAAGGLVAGSSGREAEDGPPAIGVSPETAAAFARTSAGYPRARIRLSAEEKPAVAENLIFDLPGQTDEWVVLSAHIDGHDLAESAIDNGAGLAVALAAARAIASDVAQCRRGLRLAFYNVEEWALTGSDRHVAALRQSERDKIALNVNPDSPAGGDRLTALTSGFVGLEPFLLRCAEAAGVPLGLYRPLQTNSDHANFAQAGIPAFRLVAGFGDHQAKARLVLTPLDTRDLVAPQELIRAATLTEAITRAALDASPEEAARWRGGR